MHIFFYPNFFQPKLNWESSACCPLCHNSIIINKSFFYVIRVDVLLVIRNTIYMYCIFKLFIALNDMSPSKKNYAWLNDNGKLWKYCVPFEQPTQIFITISAILWELKVII